MKVNDVGGGYTSALRRTQDRIPKEVQQRERHPSPIVKLPDGLKEEVVNNLMLTDCWHLRETNKAFKKACSKKIDAFKKFKEDIKGLEKKFQKILIQLYKNDPTLTKLNLLMNTIGVRRTGVSRCSHS